MTDVLADWRPCGQPFTIDKELYELFQDIQVLCEMLDLKLHSFGDKNSTWKDNNVFIVAAGVYSWEIIIPNISTSAVGFLMDFLYDKNCHIYKVIVWEYQKLKKSFVGHEKETDKEQLQIVINKIKGV